MYGHVLFGYILKGYGYLHITNKIEPYGAFYNAKIVICDFADLLEFANNHYSSGNTICNIERFI